MKNYTKQKKRLLAAASVFAIALGTGFLMQKVSPVADRFIGGDGGEAVAGSATPANAIQPLSAAPQKRSPWTNERGPDRKAAVKAEVSAPVVPAPETGVEVMRSAVSLPMPVAQPRTEPPVMPIMMAALSSENEMMTDAAPSSTFAPAVAEACSLKLNAKAVDAAMVRLTLSAPCNPGEPVTLKQGPLVFTEVTDAAGALTIDVPALSAKAAFEARFATGERALAMTLVQGLDSYERTALTWRGQPGVALHAFENGADHGTEGHVDASAPADPSRALSGKGGFITLLGAADMPGAMMAEVYSYPTAAGGTVQIDVEAEVTAANCGREINAEVLIRGALGFTPRRLAAPMPECDAVGEFLVFSGILPVIRLASAE